MPKFKIENVGLVQARSEKENRAWGFAGWAVGHQVQRDRYGRATVFYYRCVVQQYGMRRGAPE